MVELSVTAMRVVAEVAARGSFTAAARALGYTQSAVSRQVAIAEDAVGAPLFERLPRGVRPTARGSVLLRHVGGILARIDAAALELAEFGETLDAIVRVGAFPTALAAMVPHALARAVAEHPALDVRIREGGSAAQLARVRARRVDLAVVASGGGLEWDTEGLRVDPLLDGEPLLAVGRAHRFAERSWVDVSELADESWIVGEGDGSGPQFGPWPTLQGEVRIVHSIRDWIARLGLVAAGLGVAVIPFLLADAVPAGVHLVRVEDPRPFRRQLLAITLPERSPAVQAVVDALVAEAAQMARARRSE